MTVTFSKTNASAATLTKNRTEGSVVPASGMCVTCVDGCIGMCEIGKSAFRGNLMTIFLLMTFVRVPSYAGAGLITSVRLYFWA